LINIAIKCISGVKWGLGIPGPKALLWNIPEKRIIFMHINVNIHDVE
jgi:hypothetical protein